MKSLTLAIGLVLATALAAPTFANEPKKETPAKTDKAAPKPPEKAASAAGKKVEKPKREKKGGC